MGGGRICRRRCGVVFIWAKAEQPLDFHVILRAPQGLEAQAFELVSGRYEYAPMRAGLPRRPAPWN